MNHNPQTDAEIANERFILVSKATHDVVWDWDLVNDTVWWNDGMAEIFGYNLNELEPGVDSWYNRIHPDDRKRVLQSIHAVIDNGGSNWSDNYRFKRADGTFANVHDRGYTMHEGGKAVRMVGSVQDITDQIVSKERAVFADQQARMTIEGTGAGSFLIDLSNNDIVYSPTTSMILTGEISAHITDEILIKHLHPDDRDIRKLSYENAFKSGQLNYEARYIWDDGSIHWIKVIGRFLYDQAGKPISISGIILDITERVEMEQLLRNREEHLRSMIEQAPIATALFVGPDLIVDITNEPMLKFWRKDASIIGKPLHEALPELVGQPFPGILREVYRTGITYHAHDAPVNLVIDGAMQTVYFNFTYKPLLNKKGEVFAIMDMSVDVTAQVMSARQLKESEERYRLLANELELRVEQRTNELYNTNQELIDSNGNLEQFAYAASHDLQEPLRKIQSFGSMLQSMYRGTLDENGTFMLNRMQNAAGRMSQMIDDLLTYSRLTNKEGSFAAVDLNGIMKEALLALEISIQEQNILIEVQPLSVVYGNAGQLVQLFQNLISNAIKYKTTDKQSNIYIQKEDFDIDELASIPQLSKNRKFTKISIWDNGIGFEEKYVDRIFQMFQRLHGKGEYSGSGIGLALCKKVVQNHNGYITAKSTPGEGSIFVVYLPIV